MQRCICPLLPSLETRTRVLVVMHYREFAKPTSSAALLASALTTCRLETRGRDRRPVVLDGLEGRRALVLYPDETARPLDSALLAEDPRPITLVIPDGTWTQAARIPHRIAAMKDLPRVALPSPASRRVGELSTFEAAAAALEIIEPGVGAALMPVFDAFVAATLASRGREGENLPESGFRG